jgi:molybdopterin-guanine dinucleotide biosynthesis protein A
MNDHNISCIILAGGRSKRMGGNDKGLQLYEGKRLVEHVIEAISPQVDDIVISANQNLDDYEALGFPVITDINNNFDGPLAGIASTIPHCRHEWILVVPCDMPSLPDSLVSIMTKHIRNERLIAISSNDRLQLVFLLHRNLLDSIRRYISGNRHTVMRWLDSIDHHIVVMDDDSCFSNINTLEQI